MHIVFTDEERKWIDKKPFHWTVKDGCPVNMKKEIQKKLSLLYRKPKGG